MVLLDIKISRIKDFHSIFKIAAFGKGAQGRLCYM